MLRKEKFKNISRATGNLFSKLPFSPNHLTVSSLLFAFIYLFFIIKKELALAILFFVLSSVLDFADGSLARFSNRESDLGSYLDTMLDRYTEAIFLFGFFFLDLTKIYFDSKIWIFLALFGSLMTAFAYLKAVAGKERQTFGQGFKKSLLDRPERLLVIFISLILGLLNISWVIYPIIFLAVFSNLTALQRIFSIVFAR